MTRKRLVPVSLLLFTLTIPFLPCTPAAEASEAHAQAALEILDGPAGDEEAAARLEDRGFTPESLASLLRSCEPPAPLPVPRGEGRVTLKAGDGRTTDLWIYVPQGYRGKRTWPAMICLHGRGGNGRQMTAFARAVAERYGYLVFAPTARKFPGMLPLHPHWWRYTEDAFPLEALRWARKHYRLDDDRVLLLGYSMGGFGAWNVGLRFPDRFAAVAPFAGGISQTEYLGQPHEKRRALLTNAAMVRLFFAHGDSDPIVPVRFDRQSHRALLQAGVPHTYREVKGGDHLLRGVLAAAEGDFEKGYLIQELFDGLKNAKRQDLYAPFDYTALQAPSRARFVAVEEASGFPAKVAGRVEAETVRLETRGVKRLRLFSDGQLGGPVGRVTVLVDGQRAFQGKPKTSLLAVVRSWRRLGDRRRVFVAEIDIDIGKNEEEVF